jgi:hypothetical protein
VGVVKRRVLRGLWRRLAGVGIIGTGLSGSGLYNACIVGRVVSHFTSSTTWPSLRALSALRGTSGGASMTTPGGAGTRYVTYSDNPPVLGAPASLIGSEFLHNPHRRGLRPSLCPNPMP